ncbi:hypothetical protein [Acidimangrovimonas sediminis]|uniref:hypothetical protein n=1 Tax=Acidimangrovimonas sediminis TaxID=2056283 RepID=UPI001E5C3C55|nr:hypothetical protein [Acidimangrovimonas sediminis]
MNASYKRRIGRTPLAGLLGGGLATLLATTAMAEGPRVKVLDKSFHTAGAMFAYTEYELAGEPLAEGLGLNLDVLDPDQANKPTRFDFSAGISAYEFSEEAMYALNYQSQLGPHMVNGPLNAKAGGTMADLGKRFLTLAASVGFPADELPLNLYPVALPLSEGTPEFRGPVDVSSVNTDSFDVTTQAGVQKTIEAITPAYFRDYGSLAWQPEAKGTVTPDAAGGALLKDVMWAQDFLGGMHDAQSDEEIDDIPAPDFDKDGKHKLGVSSADGINGVILTQMAWDQLLTLRDQFLYDGKTLGAKLDPSYDGSKPVWIPAATAVTLSPKNGMNALADLKVSNGASTLRGTWEMLWPLAEMYGYTDQRTANKGQNNAFLAVFDGAPFPSAPEANRATARSGYVAADDPFSVAEQMSNMAFVNLSKLHFDPEAGTLVDRWTPEGRGKVATTFDSAYALVAAGIYARAIEALPVGYASGDTGKPLGTPEGKTAMTLIKAQADFIVKTLIGKDGLVADSYTIGKGPSAARSLGTQFAAIRGLAAAFTATGDETYRTAARGIYTAVEAHMVDKASGLYDPTPGKPFDVDPWTQGAVMGGLHALMQVLVNREGETDPTLGLQNLTQRYATWFGTVGYGVQLAEWVGDSGEHLVEGDTSGDINGNGVKGLTFAGGKYGTAQVMAAKIRVTPGS